MGADKCVPLNPCSAHYSRQALKPRLQIFIADCQDGVGGVVADIMREEFQATYDLRIFFTRCAAELLKAAELHCFDLFILNADVMKIASRLNYIESLELRKHRTREMVGQIGSKEIIPVIVLYSWGDSVFGDNIAGTRYAFELPCSIYELREAIKACVTGRFNAAED
jgi:hypothetical protein